MAKRLGVLYRQSNDFAKSEAFFNKALAFARSANLREIEAESLGEIGLLEFLRGNKDKAAHSLQECVDILRTTKNPVLERWEKELAKMR